MKKKTIQFCTFCLLILSAISFYIGVNMNSDLKNTLFQNIEAMADDENIDDTVMFFCEPRSGSVCIIDGYVSIDRMLRTH